MEGLRKRIENRKIVREEQIEARNKKLKAREAQLALEREKREAIENRRKLEEEERKKATMAAIQYATSNPKKRLQKVFFSSENFVIAFLSLERRKQAGKEKSARCSTKKRQHRPSFRHSTCRKSARFFQPLF